MRLTRAALIRSILRGDEVKPRRRGGEGEETKKRFQSRVANKTQRRAKMKCEKCSSNALLLLCIITGVVPFECSG